MGDSLSRGAGQRQVQIKGQSFWQGLVRPGRGPHGVAAHIIILPLIVNRTNTHNLQLSGLYSRPGRNSSI